MIRRVLDVLLLSIALAGTVPALRTAREVRRLTIERDRLAKIAGDLVVVDRSKTHWLALDTGEPMHFAWHVYTPANCRLILRSDTVPEASFGFPQGELIVRLRFRDDLQRNKLIFINFEGHESYTYSLDATASGLMRDYEKTLKIEQGGALATAVVDPARPFVLLRITLPQEAVSDAEKKLDERLRKKLPVLYQLTIPAATKP